MKVKFRYFFILSVVGYFLQHVKVIHKKIQPLPLYLISKKLTQEFKMAE